MPDKVKSRMAEFEAEYQMGKEHRRAEEIRRLAREALMQSSSLGFGTKEELLARVIRKATAIFDEIEAINIPAKVVAE